MADSHPKERRDWALWWFASLAAALKDGDKRATEAVRRLEKLGIEIRFRLPPLPTAKAQRDE